MLRGRRPVAARRPGQQLGDEAGEDGQRRAGGGRDGLGVHVTGERAEHLDDRAEREGVVAEGHRAALEDEPALVAQPGRRLGHEPALADARLTADEHDGGSRVLGGPRGREERREFVGATDEHRAGQAAGHAADDIRWCAPPPSGRGVTTGLTPQLGRSEETRNGVHRRGGG